LLGEAEQGQYEDRKCDVRGQALDVQEHGSDKGLVRGFASGGAGGDKLSL
jgi:hypothetical protein